MGSGRGAALFLDGGDEFLAALGECAGGLRLPVAGAIGDLVAHLLPLLRGQQHGGGRAEGEAHHQEEAAGAGAACRVIVVPLAHFSSVAATSSKRRPRFWARSAISRVTVSPFLMRGKPK